jgi:hypothetical protein
MTRRLRLPTLELMEPTTETSLRVLRVNDSCVEKSSSRTCRCNQLPRKDGRNLAFLPILGLALLPKCPICVALWFGVASMITPNSWLTSVRALPLNVLLVACVLVPLLLDAWHSRNARPVLLSLLAVVTLWMGKFVLDNSALQYVGVSLLTGAVIWSHRTMRLVRT